MPILPDELLNVLLQQLQQSAQRRPDLIRDPRTQQVATYLGRVISPEDNPAEVQRRFPQAELETGGTATQAGDLLKPALIAGITKAQLKAGVRPTTQIAQIASKDIRPLAESTKMWPAWINEKTGEVRHAMQPILQGWHEPNTPMKMLNKKMTLDPNWTRGHVDPITWNAFPENRF
jgi:hypothetical protein